MMLCLAGGSAMAAGATEALTSPVAGVLCDRSFCADIAGVSLTLTRQYLGEKPYQVLHAAGSFDTTRFTYKNGVFCDVTEKVCRENRYFGLDGKRSGAINAKYTQRLFGESKNK